MAVKILTLGMILVASLCGCRDAGVEPDSTSTGGGYPALPDLLQPPAMDSQIMPLAIGNSWKFVDSLFNIDGSKETYTFSWRVSGLERILAGSDSIDVHIVELGPSYAGIMYLRAESDGLCGYSSGENSSPGHYNLRTILVKYPITVGDSFVGDHGDYKDRHTCLSVDTLLVTPVGQFRCIMVRNNPGGTWYTDIFYRPGVGKMGEIAYDLTRPPLVRYKRWLVSYTVG